MQSKLKIAAGLIGLLLFLQLHAQAQGLSSLLFSLQDEVNLGRQVAEEVERDPRNRILDEKKFPQAYAHLRRITSTILNSGQVRHKDAFPWQVKIIHNDTILNAFCAPGGFIYVYTGIIKYLDTEDEFAGVMAHEIAHADRRHSTNNLVKMFGVQTITQLILGRASGGTLAQVGQSFLGLGFSRTHEREADDFSVVYLCNTPYRADGAAGFFEKMQQSGAASPPEFLSTHPNAANRVAAIRSAAQNRKCPTRSSANTNYQAFKRSLPR